MNVFNKISKKIPIFSTPVSIIIPTRNRVPYSPKSLNKELNPLKWCLDSIAWQEGGNVREVIIVDDYSDDYTQDFLNYYRNNTNLSFNIIVLRNQKKLNVAKSRNLAIKQASSVLIFSMDDDCVMHPLLIMSGVYYYEYLKSQRYKLGIINLPVYNRRTEPIVIPDKEISHLDLERGIFTCRADGVPVTQITNPNLIKKSFLLSPIEISNFSGHVLFSKDFSTKIGGFPEFAAVSNGSEGELAAQSTEKGYRSFLAIDPVAHSFHAKYGRPLAGDHLTGYDWKRGLRLSGISLKMMIKNSIKERMGTGSSIPTEIFAYGRIRNYAHIFRRNRSGQRKWLEKSYQSFVKENNFYGYGNLISDQKTRLAAWRLAFEHANTNYVFNQNYTIENISEDIKRLKYK